MKQNASTIFVDIRKALTDNIDSKALRSSERFFKEEVKPYGVKVLIVSQISKYTFK